MEQQRATLKQVVGEYYKPEEYLSEDELSLIRSTFSDNRLVKVVRKILLPTIADPELPLEELASDTWLAGRAWAQIPAEEAKIMAVARQDAIEFIMGGLIKLKVIANQKPETEAEKAYRRTKDSAK